MMIVTTGRLSYHFQRPNDEINALAWSSDGRWIVCATLKGAILVLDAASGKERTAYQIGNEGTMALEWFPDNHHLLTWFEKHIVIYDAWSGKRRDLYQHGIEGVLGTLGAHQSPPHGILMASSAYEEDGPTVQVREIETGHCLATFSPREPFDDLQAELAEAELPVCHPPLYPISWSPRARYIAMGQQYKVFIWDPATDQRVFLHSIASKNDSFEQIEQFAWSPDERCLVFARQEEREAFTIAKHTIEVWDWVAGEQWSTYRGHTSPILFLQWVPEKDQIVSASRNELHLWDAHTGVCIARSLLPIVEDKRTVLDDAVLSPDRSQVALAGIRYLPEGGEEGLLWVWHHGLEI